MEDNYKEMYEEMKQLYEEYKELYEEEEKEKNNLINALDEIKFIIKSL